MFSCPSGANVSWSRAPPPKVITTTFLFLRVVAARAIALGPSSALPSASPAAVRRNSRRLQASCRASSRGLEAALQRPGVSRFALKSCMPLQVQI